MVDRSKMAAEDILLAAQDKADGVYVNEVLSGIGNSEQPHELLDMLVSQKPQYKFHIDAARGDLFFEAGDLNRARLFYSKAWKDSVRKPLLFESDLKYENTRLCTALQLTYLAQGSPEEAITVRGQLESLWASEDLETEFSPNYKLFREDRRSDIAQTYALILTDKNQEAIDTIATIFRNFRKGRPYGSMHWVQQTFLLSASVIANYNLDAGFDPKVYESEWDELSGNDGGDKFMVTDHTPKLYGVKDLSELSGISPRTDLEHIRQMRALPA